MLSQACSLTAGKMSKLLSNIEFTEDESSEVERLAMGTRVTELGRVSQGGVQCLIEI
jgi:hypothetical protein